MGPIPRGAGEMTRSLPAVHGGGRQRLRVGLRGKLLLLLLAFGVIPLVLAISLGYTASRATITDQAEEALREVAERQAAQLATELSREPSSRRRQE